MSEFFYSGRLLFVVLSVLGLFVGLMALYTMILNRRKYIKNVSMLDDVNDSRISED